MKIRVRDKEHSKQIQTIFIKQGYTWSGSITNKEMQFLDKPFLWMNDSPVGGFAYADNEKFFVAHKQEEIFILEKSHIKFLRRTITADFWHVIVKSIDLSEIFDKQYYTKDNQKVLNIFRKQYIKEFPKWQAWKK